MIQIDNEFIVVGGSGERFGGSEDEPTESCKLNGKSMRCKTRKPKLSDFAFYPELMLIP